MKEHITAAFSEMTSALQSLSKNQTALKTIEEAAGLFVKSLREGGRIYSCGNGGSHCDAMHFAEELSGRFRDDRKPLAAVAISDSAHLTCTANDYGYEEVFSRFVQAHGRKGDVLLAISTSGKSQSIINAAEAARKAGVKVVSLTGREKSPLAEVANVDICAPVGKYADRIQELHIKVIHIFIELIERQLFPQNYGVS